MKLQMSPDIRIRRAHKIGHFGQPGNPETGISPLNGIHAIYQSQRFPNASESCSPAEDSPQKVIMFYDGSDAEIVESRAWSRMESRQPGDPLPVN